MFSTAPKSPVHVGAISGATGLGGGGAGPTPAAKAIASQDMGSPHNGMMSSITPGEPLSRAMGQYGKGHSLTKPPQAGGPQKIRKRPKDGAFGAIPGGQGMGIGP